MYRPVPGGAMRLLKLSGTTTSFPFQQSYLGKYRHSQQSPACGGSRLVSQRYCSINCPLIPTRAPVRQLIPYSRAAPPALASQASLLLPLRGERSDLGPSM